MLQTYSHTKQPVDESCESLALGRIPDRLSNKTVYETNKTDEESEME